MEKLHPDGSCGKTVVVIDNSPEYIPPCDGTCPNRSHNGYWSLLVDSLMGSGSIVKCHIFLQPVVEMTFIQDEDVIHINLGDIADESRGEGNVLRYPVPASSYAEAVELPLQGLALDKATPPPMAPVLPLEDLIITKILPVGRTTDMEDVVLLLVTAVEQISLDKIGAKIRDLEELKPAILERLEDLAEFILEHQIGTTWLGRPWKPAERTRVLRFIRKLNSQVQ